uniref:RING-type E3 ubiquitin transferase n=1 Tax=Esox lucius TaxID=8010 RepID=A0A3P8XST9_ESOLU
MDESSLLDLLECSVCLERLDTTAKVLPCQHTFCRRCLENIVSSRNELRCPECRILVGCEVDDLPANILLVRLLDGIKQRPRNGGSTRQSLVGGGGSLVCAAGISASPPDTCPHTQSNRLQPLHNGQDPRASVPALPCGKALYSYEGKEPGDLQFTKGDIIILRRKVDDNWYHGELNGCHGFLPASYITLLRPLSQTPPTGKALYDFEVKDKDQDKDCLAFSKRPTAAVRPQNSSPPRSAGQSARPMSMVSPGPSPLSSPASRPLSCLSSPLLPLSSPLSCLTPPNTSAALLNGESTNPFQPPSPGPSHSNSHGAVAPKPEKVKKKGGLLKLLSGAAAKKKSSRSPPSSPPNLPLSGAVLPHHTRSGSCPMEAQGRAGSCPIESEMAGAMGLEPLHRKSGSLDLNFPRSPPTTRSGNALLALRPEPKPLSRERYRALVPYPPQSEAEIELREGDVVFVHKKREDGWYKGTLQRTGRTGLFPGSFVEIF